MTPEPEIVTTESGSTQHVWPLAADEDTLRELLTTLFTDYWPSITFGPIIEGAAWEVGAPGPPEAITVNDGYATIDFGPWHFHLCIGDHSGSSTELARVRRCSRAELYRGLGGDGTPVTWGMRLFNGRGEQMMTVLLPNPFLTDRQGVRDTPDFSRLAAWDTLRERFLGLGPDPLDRSGLGFAHTA